MASSVTWGYASAGSCPAISCATSGASSALSNGRLASCSANP